MTEAIHSDDCSLPTVCRDNWHVFDWTHDTDTLTCHCGVRSLAVERLTPEDVHVSVA